MARLGYLLSKRVLPPVSLPLIVIVAVAENECQSWRGDDVSQRAVTRHTISVRTVVMQSMMKVVTEPGHMARDGLTVVAMRQVYPEVMVTVVTCGNASSS